MKARDPRTPALAGRIRQVVDRFESIAEAAKITGIPVNTVSRLRRGENEPGAFDLIDLATKTGTDLAWLAGLSPESTIPGRQSAFAKVPMLDVEAAAGAGQLSDQVEKIADLEFPVGFLQSIGASPRHTQALKVKEDSDSMVPTLLPGALIMIDVSKKDRPRPRTRSAKRRVAPPVFVFYQRDLGVRVKRIETVDDDHAAVISDNTASYPIEMVRHRELTIIGRVIWAGNPL